MSGRALVRAVRRDFQIDPLDRRLRAAEARADGSGLRLHLDAVGMSREFDDAGLSRIGGAAGRALSRSVDRAGVAVRAGAENFKGAGRDLQGERAAPGRIFPHRDLRVGGGSREEKREGEGGAEHGCGS